MAVEETSKMLKKIESLKSELKIVKEEKAQALSNENLANSMMVMVRWKAHVAILGHKLMNHSPYRPK